MLTSVPVNASEEYARNFQSNQTTIRQDSSIRQQEKNILVLRRSPRLRELIPKEPIQTLDACSSFEPKDILVRQKPGKQRKLIPNEIVCALSSAKQEKEVLVFCRNRRKRRSSTRTCEKTCNKTGENAQVDYQIGGTGEPSDIVKQNDNVLDEQVNHPIWSGSISVSHENFGVVDGLAAYMSSRAGAEVLDAVPLLPALIHAQVLSRQDVWPASFHDCPPTDDIIDLYILPANERSEDVFYRFLDAIMRKDVLKAVYANVSILIFSSFQLKDQHWRTTSGKYYLWAVFEGKNSFFPHSQKNNSFELNIGCDNPFLRLTDEPQLVTENEEDRENIHGVMLEIESHPIGSAADSDLAEQENYVVNARGSPSAIQNFSTPDVQVVSESIGASVLEMANKFDDQSCAAVYSVDPKHARIFRAILNKHGDITRDCPIQSTKIVTCALEGICASVEELENIQFVNLLPSHLQSMHSAITDAELMKLDVKWLHDSYEEFVEAIEHLKAYKNLKERRKEVDRGIAIKKTMRSSKKDEMLKLEGEIEKLDAEIAEATQVKETLSSGIRNVTSKCKLWCQNSLIDGLV